MLNKKTYEKRTDIERLQSQWAKLKGLQKRREWSSAIVRAATAAEIAANYVIRAEFKKQGNLSDSFVDEMLLWANGLNGKINRLVIPLATDTKRRKELARLKKQADEINRVRNKIVHSGSFENERPTDNVVAKTKQFIQALLAPYIDKSELDALFENKRDS